MADAITIEGIEDINRAISEIADVLDYKIVKKAIGKSLVPFRKMAVGEVPVRTGLLKKAIQIRAERKRGQVYINPMVMGAANSKTTARFKLIGIKRSITKVADQLHAYASGLKARFIWPVKYGWLQEIGTKRFPGHGFMASARTGAAEQGLKEFEKELISGVEQAAQKEGLAA